MGGEKPTFFPLSGGWKGSPPRGRGKGLGFPALFDLLGITPAWAGKSQRAPHTAKGHQDHPRVGGEKCVPVSWATGPAGSPPRGRGKVWPVRKEHCEAGITPAWAGKRLRGIAPALWAGDHPRVGGEKQILTLLQRFRPGSPPRGRGKAAADVQQELDVGITPAWAGKRLKRSHRSGIFISGPIPFHSVLHRPAGSGGSRAGRDGSPAGQPQNAGPA